MNKTAIIYSFNTKNSGRVAEKIKEAFGKDLIDTINAEELTEEQFLSYKNLILASPTWFDGELASYWDEFVPALENMDLKDKTIAIFGMGDQLGYPENFGDALGILAEIMEKQGAKLVGQTQAENYTFEKSKALRNGNFLGLMIDSDNQDEMTDDRVKNWVNDIKQYFN